MMILSGKRNYGIDLIRIVAMLFVVTLHNLGQGGVLYVVPFGSINWWLSWGVESLAIVAVNLFAMITGYLCVNKQFKSKRILSVIVQAIFWSVVVTAFLVAVGFRFTRVQILRYIDPFWEYWYVSAYVGVMLLSPVINIGLKQLPKSTFRKVLLVLLLVSSTLGWIGQFFLLKGYSAFWLLEMYMVGAYFKLYGKSYSFSKTKIRTILVLSIIGSTAFEFLAFHFGYTKPIFISYVAPLVVSASIALFALLIDIDIRSKWVQEILKVFAPLSFGVYLIDQSPFYGYILPNLFKPLSIQNSPWLLLVVVVVSIGFYLIFSCLDYLRIVIFKYLGLNSLLSVIDRKINHALALVLK